MGCENSKRDIKLRLDLDSRYFREGEYHCTKSLNSPVQDLFREAKKRLINQEENIDMKMCIGSSLIDSSSTMSLKELGIYENSKVTIGIRPNVVKIRVLIQSENPTKAVVPMQKKKTILDLKKKIMKSVDPADVLVMYRYVVLPNEVQIKQLNFKEQEVLTLVVKQDCNLLAIWKYKYPGLIIEGLCMNSNCQAYRQRVSISKGFGVFEILGEVCQSQECPICTETVSKVVSVGLAWCSYSVEYMVDQEKVVEDQSVYHYKEIPEVWGAANVNVKPLQTAN